MLGKLLRYEWKSVWKVETFLAAILLVFSLAEALTLQTPMYANLFLDQKDLPDGLKAFAIFTIMGGAMAMILMCTVAGYISVIYFGVRYFRSMFGDEGYLTHTLPVSKKTLMASKYLTAVIWQILISVTIGVCVLIIGASVVLLQLRNGVPLSKVLEGIMEAYESLFENTGVLVHMLIAIFLRSTIQPVVLVATLFGALSIGQLFNKQRGFWGVVMYFAINFATGLIGGIFRGIGNVLMIDSISGWDDPFEHFGSWLFFSVDLSLVISLLVAVGLTIFAHHIISEKLNLQ
ncbi:MAG: hypothetical protein K6F53_11425 [Lachnospiraceae bacterium]|nr:hypothetical protein [Lachnospiraceae bacterium]